MHIDNLALEEPFDDEAGGESPAVEADGDSKHWGLAIVVLGIALALYGAIAYGLYVLVSELS